MVGDGGAEGVAAVGGEEEGEEKSVERRGLRGGCNERDSDDKLAKTGKEEDQTSR